MLLVVAVFIVFVNLAFGSCVSLIQHFVVVAVVYSVCLEAKEEEEENVSMERRRERKKISCRSPPDDLAKISAVNKSACCLS